jgi:uncharacterized cupin superfamily protein
LKIKIKKMPQKELDKMNVKEWPIWECRPSTFDWHYDREEMCLILEGDFTVKTIDGKVHIGPGDFVTFPKGLDCTWNVKKTVRKHYNFK